MPESSITLGCIPWQVIVLVGVLEYYSQGYLYWADNCVWVQKRSFGPSPFWVLSILLQSGRAGHQIRLAGNWRGLLKIQKQKHSYEIRRFSCFAFHWNSWLEKQPMVWRKRLHDSFLVVKLWGIQNHDRAKFANGKWYPQVVVVVHKWHCRQIKHSHYSLLSPKLYIYGSWNPVMVRLGYFWVNFYCTMFCCLTALHVLPCVPY